MRILMILGLVALTAFGLWNLPLGNQTSASKKQYLHDGRVFNKRQVEFLVARFTEKGVHGVEVEKGKLLVPVLDREVCNEIAASTEFAKLSDPKNSSASGFSNPFLSQAEKEMQVRADKLRRLENILRQIAGIRDVIILYDEAKSSDFSRRRLQTAAITLWSEEGESISQVHAVTTTKIVCKAFAGMEESNVLVVDGGSGMILQSSSASKEIATPLTYQLELEALRRQIELESRKLLTKFGETQVTVRMDLERRTVLPLQVSKEPVPNEERNKESSVVANGTGSISTKSKNDDELPESRPKPKVVMIKRLMGIEVSIPKNAVNQHIQQSMGTGQEITEEQFSRAVVAIRNEITKELVRWLRIQKGIEASSDLVSVFVAQSSDAAESTDPSIATGGNSDWNAYVVPAAAGIGLLVAITMLLFSLKGKRNKITQPRQGQLSDGGRAFVSRNLKPAGQELVEEAADVIQTTPENSARAFQNLVTGESN